MADWECDVAVIGAGTAGLAAERRARKAGARTLLIDDGFAGSTCAVSGCMPSKLLIAAADTAWSTHEAHKFGVRATAEIEGPAVMARLRKERDRFVASVQDTINDIPKERRISSRARFVAPRCLALADGTRIEAKAVVIATGAAPVVPEAFADLQDLLLTNQSLFELEDLPNSMAVIGAGPLGLEMAQALARLGVEIEVFDKGDGLAGLGVPAVSDKLRERLSKEFPLHLGVSPSVTRGDKGVSVSFDGETRHFERLLVAAGRKPELDALNLEAAEIALDDHGTPVFSPQTLQCGAAPVFIAGDANHDRPFLHEAAHEGVIAGMNAAAYPQEGEAHARHVPLAITFTRPETASVGEIPDAEAEDIASADASFDNQGRSTMEGREGGLCRLFARRSDGRLTGASLYAPSCEHLAHLLAWAIASGLKVSDLLDMPYYHPTFEEGIKPALRELCSATRQAHDQSREEDSPLS